MTTSENATPESSILRTGLAVGLIAVMCGVVLAGAGWFLTSAM